MIPHFIRSLFGLDAPHPAVVVRQLPTSPEAQQDLAEAETREMNSLAEAETSEIRPQDLEEVRRANAYYLAEADGFRRSPEEYWAEAAHR